MKKQTIYLLVVLGIIAAILIVFTAAKPAEKQSGNQTAGLAGGTVLRAMIGKSAPSFALKDINGNTVNLNDVLGKKNAVLFFTEGAMCYPACWNQMTAFAKDARFNSSSTQAFSIVVDTPQEWRRIEDQTPEMRGAQILFDMDRSASQAYGVLTLPSSMHPGSFPGHTYFLIDKSGVIRYAWDDPMMGVRNDAIWQAMQSLR